MVRKSRLFEYLVILVLNYSVLMFINSFWFVLYHLRFIKQRKWYVKICVAFKIGRKMYFVMHLQNGDRSWYLKMLTILSKEQCEALVYGVGA